MTIDLYQVPFNKEELSCLAQYVATRYRLTSVQVKIFPDWQGKVYIEGLDDRARGSNEPIMMCVPVETARCWLARWHWLDMLSA